MLKSILIYQSMIKYDMEISMVKYISYYDMYVILIDMIYSILIYYDQNGDILFLIYEKEYFTCIC